MLKVTRIPKLEMVPWTHHVRSVNSLFKECKMWSIWPTTVCPGSSHPPEKTFNIFATKNKVIEAVEVIKVAGF